MCGERNIEKWKTARRMGENIYEYVPEKGRRPYQLFNK